MPRIKRQVASVSKKAKEPSDSNNSNSLSGPEHPPKVKYFSNNKITTPQHPPKVKYTGTVTVKEQQYELPTSKPRSHRRRCRTGKPAHREEDDQVDNRPVKFQSSQTNNGRATSLGGRQSMLPRRISTPSQNEIKSVSNNRYCSSTSRTTTSSQSEITSEYDASSEPSSRKALRPSSPECGNLSVRTVYSPTPEMAIIHRTMHDAIHAVREQQGRVVTRSLLSQQKAIAASKLQCNIQIKRTSMPEHPPMSNVPPRRARARSEKANGVTSGSSEESDSEPQTSRIARFQALTLFPPPLYFIKFLLRQ